MATYQLVIGNKVSSSWSLRPWLLMRRFGIPFDEIHVDLRAADVKAQIARHSPTGLVPVLKSGDLAIADSLAIAEHLAETHPDLRLWPTDPRARAVARMVSAEMHSGFRPLRMDMPFAILETMPRTSVPEDVAADIRRIVASWRTCRSEHTPRLKPAGPFLLGDFSIADAMYAPIASRFRTYVPDLAPYGDDGTAAVYVATMMALPEMAEWIDGARRQAVVNRG